MTVEPTERIAAQQEQVRDRMKHLRLPSHLVPMPGRRLDLVELEDWIVVAFCVAYASLNGKPPPLDHAAAISGRSQKRVKASWERSTARGWLGMAKVPHQYGQTKDGKPMCGKRWRTWVPSSSPFAALMDGNRDGAFRFVAVPRDVCRDRSVLSVALYMLVHEQRRIDGAATLTCSEMASILSCDRNTVRRLLERIDAVAVERPRPGVAMYDMPIVFEGKRNGEMALTPGGFRIPVYGDEKRQIDRVTQLVTALAEVGISQPGQLLDATARELHERLGYVRVDLVVRVVEERYRRRLSADRAYRIRAVQRLGNKLRGMLRRPSRLERELAADTPRDRHSMASELRDSVVQVCTTCDNDRIVVVDRNNAVPCPDCAPPG